MKRRCRVSLGRFGSGANLSRDLPSADGTFACAIGSFRPVSDKLGRPFASRPSTAGRATPRIARGQRDCWLRVGHGRPFLVALQNVMDGGGSAAVMPSDARNRFTLRIAFRNGAPFALRDLGHPYWLAPMHK